MTPPLLRARRLDVAVAQRLLVRQLEVQVAAGEIVGVLGVNGAGKSTTLETLCGLRPPAAGRIELGGRALDELALAERARRIGLMLQSADDGFPMRALDLVAMGRHPHKNLLAAQDDVDLDHARASLARVGLAGFDERRTDTLSGGERQRLALAMLLCQAPALMLLDEPVSQLDPRHRRRVAAVLGELRDRGHGIVLSAHDVNFAAAVCDRVLLLYGSADGGPAVDAGDGDSDGHGDGDSDRAPAASAASGRWRLGPADEVLTAETLSALYHTPVRRLRDGERDWFAML